MFKIGKPYYIKFLDHCLTSQQDEEVECEVMGWVHDENQNVLTLVYWKTTSNTDPETDENNSEFIKIIKSTIKSKRVICLK